MLNFKKARLACLHLIALLGHTIQAFAEKASVIKRGCDDGEVHGEVFSFKYSVVSDDDVGK